MIFNQLYRLKRIEISLWYRIFYYFCFVPICFVSNIEGGVFRLILRTRDLMVALTYGVILERKKHFLLYLSNLVYMTNTSFEMTNISNLTSRISLMLHLKIKFSLFTRILIMLPYFSDSRVSNFSWHSILTWIKVISIFLLLYTNYSLICYYLPQHFLIASYCFYLFHSNSFIICSTIIILLHLVSQGIQFRVFTDRNT